MKKILFYVAALIVVLIVSHMTRDVIIYNLKGDGFDVSYAIFIVGVSLILAKLAHQQQWLK